MIQNLAKSQDPTKNELYSHVLQLVLPYNGRLWSHLLGLSRLHVLCWCIL
eukprot:XP_001704796.1 Hypothetical protein GL50803_33348 [Giardia lamblia ATCC 50803]